MKKILLTVLVLLICVNVFAVEEKIITLDITREIPKWDKKTTIFLDVYFNDQGNYILKFTNNTDDWNYDSWFAIEPFSLKFSNTHVTSFRNILDKFIEWDDKAVENSVYDLEKRIEYSGDRVGNFTYIRKSNKSKLRMGISHDYYSDDIYILDSNQVKKLRYAISEESTKIYKDRVELRKKQMELFN